ncbi:hypothetical protein BpHYR1_025566 [Brachionus plicatilis]|uniref:Uncharacterized protein n=1 Tax=Brachionus plicatilis TaxID=10195 RepID=A0A3M7Q2U3_BRAPC|nr:hypothetical protein BpHYR1_025566 [Brachionus plicatilis]
MVHCHSYIVQKSSHQEVSNAKLCNESNIIKGCKNNPKRIFSYINSQKNSRDRIRSLKDEMGNLFIDNNM